MRIRNDQDVTILDKRINDELGIDLKKYRNEEVIENFSALLVFPEYVVNWVIRPVLIALLFYILGFFFFDLVNVEYLIYGLIGLILFLATGILFGFFFLVRKMKSDMQGIINYSLDILKSAIADLGSTQKQLTPKNKKYIFRMLFQGIIHIITIPILGQILTEKIPVVGGFFSRLIKRILTYISNKFSIAERQLKQELKREDNSNIVVDYTKQFTLISKGLSTTLNITFGIAKWPLLIGAVFSFLILLLFLTIIN